MKTFIILTFLLLILGNSLAAVSYQVETRYLGYKPGGCSSSYATNLVNAFNWASQPYGYCSRSNPNFPLNNRSLCTGGSDRNIAWKFTFNFDESENANYRIRFGTDFGWGAAVFVDDVLQSTRTDDMWWAGNWGSWAVFTLEYNFSAGSHSVVVYGAEGCCDGNMDIQLSRNWGSYHSFNLGTIQSLIPEPQPEANPYYQASEQIFVKVDSRYLSSQANGSGEQFVRRTIYQFDNQGVSNGYCNSVTNPSWPVENSSTCGGGDRNIVWRFVYNFYAPYTANWQWQFGTDFGWGWGIYINGQYHSGTNSGTWWAGNWGNSTVLKINQTFAQGWQQIVVYGSEDCCDGQMRTRFSFDGRDWQDATQATLTTVSSYIVHDGTPFYDNSLQETAVIFESRYGASSASGQEMVFAENLINQFEEAGTGQSGYCEITNVSYPVTNAGSCGGNVNRNILWRMIFNFYVGYSSTWRFQMGVDFGRGYTAFVDNQFYTSRTNDIWWSNNWNSAAIQQIQGDFEQGWHQIVVYGSEGCCDGNQVFRFSVDGYDWKDATVANLQEHDQASEDESELDGPINYIVETRQIDSKPSGDGSAYAENLVNAFNDADQPNGYCTRNNPSFPLNNRSLCGSSVNSNITWKFTFTFNDAEDAFYSIRFGTDFGWGGAVFVDDEFQFARTDDLWWAGNWNSGAVFTLEYEFSAGEHEVVVYGAEGCCDGNMNIQFKRNNGAYTNFVIGDIRGQIPQTPSAEGNPFNTSSEEIYVQIDSRAVNAGVNGLGESFAKRLIGQFDNTDPSEGYCNGVTDPSWPVENSSTCGGGDRDIVWRMIFNFYVPFESEWEWEFGTDFGRGWGLYVDGQFTSNDHNGTWWAGNWNNATVIRQSLTLSAGWHIIVIYGSEDCCDGQQQVRFAFNGEDWQLATEANLTTVSRYIVHDGTPYYNPDLEESAVIVESRFGNQRASGEGEEFSQNLINQFEESVTEVAGYCLRENVTGYPIKNRDCEGANKKRNILWRIVFNFYVGYESRWRFQFGVDFGRGYTAYVDNVRTKTKTNDIWWSNNWNNAAVQQVAATFEEGWHQIVLYGSEGCCDGNQWFRFSVNGFEWQDVTVENFNAVDVEPPVPSGPIYYTVQTKNISSKPEGEDLVFAQNLVNAFSVANQPNGYCTRNNPNLPLNNKSMCSTNVERDIGWKFEFNFNDAEAASYSIRFGTDFGWGAAVFVDDEFQFARTDDLWWAGNWNSGDVFTLDYDFTAGSHTVTVYGAEGCCDGNQNIQFSRNGGEYQNFNLQNLEDTIPQEASPEADPFNTPSEEIYVQIDSRYSTGAATATTEAKFGRRLVGQFDSIEPSEGYCNGVTDPSWPVENSSTCEGGDRDIAWRFIFNFYVPYNSEWQWEFGTDFGRGWAIYVNGILYEADTTGTWWSRNWNNPTVIRAELEFTTGWNQIVVYGSEECCDGAQQARFSFNGEDWQQATEANLTIISQYIIHDGSPYYNPDLEEATVMIESRYGGDRAEGEGEEFSTNLINQFEESVTEVEGYCTWESVSEYPIKNRDCDGPNKKRNILWRFVINFYVAYSSTWRFQLGVDFGRGYTAFIDNERAVTKTNDIWWNNNWNSAAVQQIDSDFTVGWHQIVVYGSEGCCDGNQWIRFSVNGYDWQDATPENLEQNDEASEDQSAISGNYWYTVETRNVSAQPSGSNEEFAENLIEAFNNAEQPNGYCTRNNPSFPFTNKSLCTTNIQNDIGWKIVINFFDADASSYVFQIGTDFGWGGSIFVDDEFQYSRTDNLWWAANWNSNAVLTLELNLEAGEHQIVVYGAENCCDGNMNIRFKRNNGEFITLSQENLSNNIPATPTAESDPYYVESEEISVQIDSRQVGASINGLNESFGRRMVAQFNGVEPSEGYCNGVTNPSWPVENSSTCSGGDRDIVWRFIFNFYVPYESEWQWEFGTDFGRGWSIFLNGSYISSSDQGTWWAGNWNNPTVIRETLELSQGWKQIVVYGSEDCCDGQQQARFSFNGEDWQLATEENLDIISQYIVHDGTPFYDGDLETTTVWVESRYGADRASGEGEEFSQNLINQFEESVIEVDGYCQFENISYPIKNQQCQGGGNRNILWRIVFNFQVGYPSYWRFQFGVDFGRGYTAYVDNEYEQSVTTDLWWNNNWNSPAIQQVDADFLPGWHQVVLYGSEGCCDGNQWFRFSVDGYDWKDVTVDNLREHDQQSEDESLLEGAINYTVETRQITSKPSGSETEYADNLIDAFNAAEQPNGYCTRENPDFPLNNRSLCDTNVNSNIGWKFTFSFNDAEDASYIIRFGTDFGWGGVVFVDDEFQFARTDDLWWAGNWNSGAVFSLEYDFSAGEHEVVVYGAEGCCDGNMNIQLKRNNGDFQNFTQENLINTIPQAASSESGPFNETSEEIYIQLDSRAVTTSVNGLGESFARRLVGQFNDVEPSEGYCNGVTNPNWPVENSSTCGGGDRDIVWRIIFNFYVPYDSEWKWDFGTDFGRGWGLFVNGEFVDYDFNGTWWAGNWNNATVIKQTLNLRRGWNLIVLYGSEDCCDGQQQVRFAFNGEDWQQATEANLEVISRYIIHDGTPYYNPDLEESTVLIESRYGADRASGEGEEFSTNLINQFEESVIVTDGYCQFENVSYPIKNQQCEGGGSRNILWRVVFNFYVGYQSRWRFQFGVDFGRGYTAYVDNVLTETRTNDIWWNNNWNSAAVQQISSTFQTGWHQIVLYGSEGCCDGNQWFRFSVNGFDWQDVTEENFDAVDVEPFEPEGPIYYTVQTKNINGKPGGEGEAYAENLVNAFNQAVQPNGYCTRFNPDLPLNNQSMCNTNVQRNIGWKFTFVFNDAENANYQIRFGTDFGWGAAVFVDNEFQFARTDDLWWAGNWNSGDVFTLDYDFEAGSHTVVVYGAEGCCDGNQNIQFSRNGGDFKNFTIDNLEIDIPQTASPQADAFNTPSEEIYIGLESREAPSKVSAMSEIVFGRRLVGQFNSIEPSEGYCNGVTNPNWPVENSSTCQGGDRNIVWRIVINFYVPYESTWIWQFGNDFGWGWALYINGSHYDADTGNTWWNGNWSNPTVISEEILFGQGWNQIVLYGSEDCCDGQQQIRFSFDGGEWQLATFDNLSLVSQYIQHDGSPFYNPELEETAVLIESRFGADRATGEGEGFARNLINQFEESVIETEGYCTFENVSYPIKNQQCPGGGDRNILWRIVFNFNVGYESRWRFQFGVDFGRGYTAFVDNEFVNSVTNDLWWNNNWNSPAVQQISEDFEEGWHQVVLYGSEGCCDGNQWFRFSVDGHEWKDVTPENLEQHDEESEDESVNEGPVSYSVETRYIAGKPSGDGAEYAENLVSEFNDAEQPNGYCTRQNPDLPLNNQSMCSTSVNSNITWKFTFNFYDADGGSYNIRFGTDFGWGAAVFVNDEFQLARTDDLWWAGNWDSGDVFTLEYTFSAGSHTVTVYGAEGCCDGNQNIQFSRNGGPYKDFNIENLTTTIPQEPSTEGEAFDEVSEDFYVQVDSRRFTEGGVSGSGEQFAGRLVGQFQGQEASEGYCDGVLNPEWPVENSSTCEGGDNDIIWRFIYNFYVPYTSSWTWQFGTDFGRGWALYVNGEFEQAETDDTWWNGNWESDAVIELSVEFNEGWNQIVLYGSEQCCDGSQNTRFAVDGGEWYSATIQNFTLIAQLSLHDGSAYYDGSLQNAAVIIETRFGDDQAIGENQQFATNLINQFESASDDTDGYCRITDVSYPISNQQSCGGGIDEDILWRVVINWQVSVETVWYFKFGVDFGRGYVAYVDNEFNSSNNSDLWWNGDWESSQVQTITQTFSVGWHQIVVYGSEGCCDGNQWFKFQVGEQGEWQDVTVPNLEAAAIVEVPEEPDCVILYTECGFQGESLNVCEDNPDTDNFDLHSIYVPEYVIATIYNRTFYNGGYVEFHESVECIESVDFQNPTFLLSHGIKFIKKDIDEKEDTPKIGQQKVTKQLKIKSKNHLRKNRR